MTQSYFVMIKIDNLYTDMGFILEKLVAFGGIIVDSGRVKEIELQVIEI